MSYTITEQKLKELLKKAYEAGWSGTKELCDSTVLSIFQEAKSELPISSNIWTTNTYTVSVDWSSGGAGGSGTGGTGYVFNGG